jgi:hypothetical protein
MTATTTSAVSIFSTTPTCETRICPRELSIICSLAMLSAEDKARVEAEVRRMVAELRVKPTQEKEDALGLEVATLPPAERDLVPKVLLRIVAEEAR